MAGCLESLSKPLRPKTSFTFLDVAALAREFYYLGGPPTLPDGDEDPKLWFHDLFELPERRYLLLFQAQRWKHKARIELVVDPGHLGYFRQETTERPPSSSPFVQAVREHLVGARVTGAAQPASSGVLDLEFEGKRGKTGASLTLEFWEGGRIYLSEAGKVLASPPAAPGQPPLAAGSSRPRPAAPYGGDRLDWNSRDALMAIARSDGDVATGLRTYLDVGEVLLEELFDRSHVPRTVKGLREAVEAADTLWRAWGNLLLEGGIGGNNGGAFGFLVRGKGETSGPYLDVLPVPVRTLEKRVGSVTLAGSFSRAVEMFDLEATGRPKPAPAPGAVYRVSGRREIGWHGFVNTRLSDQARMDGYDESDDHTTPYG